MLSAQIDCKDNTIFSINEFIYAINLIPFKLLNFGKVYNIVSFLFLKI